MEGERPPFFPFEAVNIFLKNRLWTTVKESRASQRFPNCFNVNVKVKIVLNCPRQFLIAFWLYALSTFYLHPHFLVKERR